MRLHRKAPFPEAIRILARGAGVTSTSRLDIDAGRLAGAAVNAAELQVAGAAVSTVAGAGLPGCSAAGSLVDVAAASVAAAIARLTAQIDAVDAAAAAKQQACLAESAPILVAQDGQNASTYPAVEPPGGWLV